MLAIKSSRKSLRLLSDEEDNLLAGVDFQTYYLGEKEVPAGADDLDAIVEGIYSQYMNNKDINNSRQLTITVDTNQLVFRDVATHHIEFIIALTSVKSVYCSSRKTKFPNAVIIVCSSPSESTATLHVLHCLNPAHAREFYNAINRAFDYHGDAGKSNGTTVDKATAFSRENKDLGTNAVSGYKVNKTKPRKYREVNSSAGPKKKDNSNNESTDLLGAVEPMPAKPEETPSLVREIPPTQVEDETRVKSWARTKSASQGAEGRGLLENIDPDDGFDDEFTTLARNRSFSENIKAKFGR